jgi:hypothetical protein
LSGGVLGFERGAGLPMSLDVILGAGWPAFLPFASRVWASWPIRAKARDIVRFSIILLIITIILNILLF